MLICIYISKSMCSRVSVRLDSWMSPCATVGVPVSSWVCRACYQLPKTEDVSPLLAALPLLPRTTCALRSGPVPTEGPAWGHDLYCCSLPAWF